MKRFLLVLIIGLGFNSISQNNFIPVVQRPADFEYLSSPDSIGKRTLVKTAVISNKEKSQAGNIKLPYPIIFIHGLNSCAETWTNTTYSFLTPQYGLVNGGRFDYSLNDNISYVNTNTNQWPIANADIALFTGTWITGDFYYLNFDVGSDGGYMPGSLASNQVLSDQSAIAKQGRALRDCIARVLLLTGRDKVVLMGHSMGGLASREYLQNPSNWQPDGKAHVAKLVTTGTPHGGSNQVTGGSLLSGVDCQSEAYRDLRTTYSGSSLPGVYLFGGTESNSVCNLSFCSNFYNVDVNCDGTIGQNITGLNYKNIYTNLDYACILGRCSGCSGQTPGDGIVLDYSADLNNFYTNLTTNVYNYYGSAVLEIHTDLPSQVYENMQGLDEPNEYLLSYNIGFDTTYTSFTTIQSFWPFDYDDFKFTVDASSIVTVNVNNIGISNLMVDIFDMSLNQVGTTVNSGGFSSITFTQTLNAGSYYLEIYGTPTTSSYLTPYNFTLSKAASGIGINEIIFDENEISIYPNPTNSKLTIESEYFGINHKIEVVNSLGESLFSSKLISRNTVVDVSHLSSGIYFLKISSDKSVAYKKFVRE